MRIPLPDGRGEWSKGADDATDRQSKRAIARTRNLEQEYSRETHTVVGMTDVSFTRTNDIRSGIRVDYPRFYNTFTTD